MANAPKIAIVIDALSTYTGAERVLAAVLELYPEAPIYTLAYKASTFTGRIIGEHEVHPSWIQQLPGGVEHYRNYLPLLPLAVEQFDLRNYDIVI
jgi:hypothetical protein